MQTVVHLLDKDGQHERKRIFLVHDPKEDVFKNTHSFYSLKTKKAEKINHKIAQKNKVRFNEQRNEFGAMIVDYLVKQTNWNFRISLR